MTAPLTGQERVNRAFERRDHDRVPRHESFWGETIERWQNEGLNGDRLVMFGNINVMVMGTNDRAQIEEEIRSKLAAGKAVKAYLYHSDHSVPPLVSWETYQFIMECLKRHGGYH